MFRALQTEVNSVMSTKDGVCGEVSPTQNTAAATRQMSMSMGSTADIVAATTPPARPHYRYGFAQTSRSLKNATLFALEPVSSF